MMDRRSVVLLLLCVVAAVVASASVSAPLAASGRVVVEQYRLPKSSRTLIPHGWRMVERAHPVRDTLTLTIAVKQRNAETLERIFWEVSNPKNPSYGKYLDFDSVNTLVRPGASTIATIRQWLVDNGIPMTRHELSPAQDFITLQRVPVGIVEKLVGVQLHRFEHPVAQKTAVRTLQDYTVPSHIAPLIDFIGGLTRFPQLKKSERIAVTSLPSGNGPIISRVLPGDGALSAFVLVRCEDGSVPQDATVLCPNKTQVSSMFLTVDSSTRSGYRAISFPDTTDCKRCIDWSGSFNSKAFWCNETVTQYQISPNSVFCSLPLLDGLTNYLPAKVQVQTIFADTTQSPIVQWPADVYPGKFVTPEVLTERYRVPPGLRGSNSESGQSVAEFLGQYYSQDDLNTFFDINGLPRQAVTVIGPNNASVPGGEASLDIQYIMGVAPNISTTFWSLGQLHDGQEPFLDWIIQVLRTSNAPYVHSVSYADDEDSLSLDFMTRVNNEFKIAGVQGISLLFSSGDNGVASSNPPVSCPGHWVPAFPPSSPYVTVVGATQFSTQTRPVCDLETNGIPTRCEEVGEIMSSTTTGSRITSGGGFSNVFGRPGYQTTVVQNYIQKSLQKVPSSWYNASGRAYPDVAACGRNFIVVIGGQLTPVDGTSAAAPTFAGVVSLLNDLRLNSGMTSLGFLNPLIYAYAPKDSQMFFDIVMGNNYCPEDLTHCCQYGLSAAVGWDAVTGFGTPNFERLAYIADNS